MEGGLGLPASKGEVAEGSGPPRGGGGQPELISATPCSPGDEPGVSDPANALGRTLAPPRIKTLFLVEVHGGVGLGVGACV